LISTRSPKVSIIIPCKNIDTYVQECVENCLAVDYPAFEVLLLPDSPSSLKLRGVATIPTGPLKPAAKRNIAAKHATGEFHASIDSDAYPAKDWLRNAMKYFDDPVVAGVGGPGLTPEGDSFMQRASGHILSSFMVGRISRRYKAQWIYESDDVHSCNFIVRKSVLEEVGGWDDRYWPGEDTLICLGIKKLGKKLVEASDVVVYHHRKPLFKEHLKQVSRFGLHRGIFARRFRGNSFKLTYFVPSLLILSLFAGVFASLINSFFLDIFVLALVMYLILGLIAALLEAKEMKLLLPVWLGIMATHVVYGVSFLMGLMKRDLAK